MKMFHREVRKPCCSSFLGPSNLGYKNSAVTRDEYCDESGWLWMTPGEDMWNLWKSQTALNRILMYLVDVYKERCKASLRWQCPHNILGILTGTWDWQVAHQVQRAQQLWRNAAEGDVKSLAETPATTDIATENCTFIVALPSKNCHFP